MDPHWLPQQFIWFLFLLVSLLLLLFKNSGRREPLGKLPPGPWKLPFLGNLHQLGSKPHDSLHKLSLKHRPLMFLKLSSIPTIAQEVFKFHDAAFSSRPDLYASRKIAYGLDMVWTSYGEYWRQLRKVSMTEVLSMKRVQSFRAVREDEVASLIAYVRSLSASSPSSTLNLSKDVFVAGSDTSSVTLVWTMTQLMRNPRVMTKLQQELQKVAGRKSKVEECDLQQLDYLKLVIKEALRLHPPGPLLVPRETTETCKIKEYYIPAKTRVLVIAKAIARDPKFWNNPDEFCPERFLENARDYRPGQHFDYMPFGVGRRGCPEINFASAIMELTLANLLHCFDWGLPFGMKAEDLDFEETFGLTTPKKKHLCLVAKAK